MKDSGASSGREQRVTSEYLQTLPWDRFEALVAVLEEKLGSRVLLTPGRGDDKADVLALRGNELRLIQCKHTTWGASIDAGWLADLPTEDKANYFQELLTILLYSTVSIG